MEVHVLSLWEEMALVLFFKLHLGALLKGVPNNNNRENMLKRKEDNLKDNRREIKDRSFNQLTRMTSSEIFKKSNYLMYILTIIEQETLVLSVASIYF
jgi:hypothetical protein